MIGAGQGMAKGGGDGGGAMLGAQAAVGMGMMGMMANQPQGPQFTPHRAQQGGPSPPPPRQRPAPSPVPSASNASVPMGKVLPGSAGARWPQRAGQKVLHRLRRRDRHRQVLRQLRHPRSGLTMGSRKAETPPAKPLRRDD